MRILAALPLIAGGAVALGWVARAHGATGVENGVLWLIGLTALIAFACVVFSELERRYA